ncbi:MAG TPA: ATP-binding protein [Burkholderiales bacterium]|nr:ATP-binding protein [Burkholderiales bacterium]
MRPPRSLAARAFLLIALLIVLSLVAAAEIFRLAEREPRARQLAQMVVSAVNLTRAGILSAEPGLRPALLDELAEAEGIRVYPAYPEDRIEPFPTARPEARLLTEEVRRHLGKETRFASARNGDEAFWVSFLVGEDEFWLMLPRERVERGGAIALLGWGALVLLLALAGAWLIARQVGRPLRALEEAARAIGHGESPRPVPESGADEVATVARAFNQMSADLAAIEHERALVLAGISHDLRTPLARLRLALELAKEADPQMVREAVKDVEAMDGIVEQFLAYVRTDGGEALRPGADLNAIVRSAAERLSSEGRAVEMHLGELPPLSLKPGAVSRLAMNLIENAFRHGAPPVEVETAVEEGRAVLRVMDRGPGIPEGERDRVLQPFARLDNARSTPGTGLGLAIVDRIARAHGTALELRARPGGGLEARLAFPISTTEARS